MTVKCSNCGARYRVALFPKETPKKENTFQSIQPTIRPLRATSSLLWEIAHFLLFMSGAKPAQPKDDPLVVRSEIKTSKHQMLINELEIPAKMEDIQWLADIYIQQKKGWSRNNSTSGTNISQTTHLKIQDVFLKLHFLEQINSTQYQITGAGYRFLRHFC